MTSLAGTPRHLAVPPEEEELMELDLGANPGSTKEERWHVHILNCEEEDLEADW